MIKTPITIKAMFIAFILAPVLILGGKVVFACDTDSECGVGGTCIKREKRARGVCYGGNQGAAGDAAPQEQPVEIIPPNQANSTGSAGADAPIYGEEGYVEPTAPPRIIDRLDVPERNDGACVTSTDCAGGQECIYRDPLLGHGLCEAPPS